MVSIRVLIGTIVLFFCISAHSAWFHDKKGAGVSLWRANGPASGFDFNNEAVAVQQLQALNPNWYYTWEALPLGQSSTVAEPNIPFIPMISQHMPADDLYYDTSVKTTIEAQLNKILANQPTNGYDFVLLFNEPDHGDAGATMNNAAMMATLTNDQVALFDQLNSRTELLSPAEGLYSLDTYWNKYSWLETYFANLNSPMRQKLKAYDRPTLPIHRYLDPVHFGFSEADLQPTSSRYNLVVHKLVQKFIYEFHRLKRKHNARLFVTEFGLEDNLERGPDNLPLATQIEVPPQLVIDVYQHLLDELSARDYIRKYAALLPARVSATGNAYSRRYVVNAGFENGGSSTMTPLGQYYANYRYDSNCQKGEFQRIVSGQLRFTEYFSRACGAPVDFGWNRSGRNGWTYNTQARRYQRDLDSYQAGFFTDKDDPNKPGCYRYRYRTYSLSEGKYHLEEVVHANCFVGGNSLHGNPPWTFNATKSEFRRSWDPEIHRIGIMQFNFTTGERP